MIVRRDYRVPGARRPPERPGPRRVGEQGSTEDDPRPAAVRVIRGTAEPEATKGGTPDSPDVRRYASEPEPLRVIVRCAPKIEPERGGRDTSSVASYTCRSEPLRLTPTTPKARTHSTTTTQRPPTWQGRKMRHLRVQRVHPCAHLPPTRGTNTQTHTRSPRSAKRSRMVCARPHTVCRPCLPLASAPRQATGFRLLPLSKEQEESGFAAGAHTRRRRRGGRHGDGVGPRWAPVGGHGGEWRGEVGWWKQTDGRARARGTPSPRTRLIGDTLLPERNRTTAAINTAAVRPLAVSALRGGWGGWRGA